MKTIAVLIPTFTVEYGIDLLSGITDFFRDKDVRLLVGQTRYPHDTETMYNYQCWSNVSLINSQQVDAVIIVSGLYISRMSARDFVVEMQRFEDKYTVSVAIELNHKKSVSFISKCDEVMNEVVKHLKDVHGCKKIGFISANSTKSSEAIERYVAFKDAVVSNGLQFNPDEVIDGAFTDFKAKDSFLEKYSRKEDIQFDAFVAANDSMAVGVINALKELGVNVPEDIKVIGYDNAIISKLSYPKLSTIDQNIYGQGHKVAEVAYKLVNGETVDDDLTNKLFPVYRQSCGCVSNSNAQWIYKDEKGKICNEQGHIGGLYEYSNNMKERNNIVTLMDIVKSSNTLRQFYYILPHIIRCAELDAMAICFYKEPVYLDYEEDFVLPEEAEVFMYADIINNENELCNDVVFNPNEILLPQGILEKSNGVHLIQPIYSGEVNYGYFVCKIRENKFSQYLIYLKILMNALAQAYEYTNQILLTEQLKSENSSLNVQSKTDELTEIYNRRGFTELGQRAIDVAQEKNLPVVVIFADMDNLKKINDTYGHDMGDRAIKTQAQVLKKAFRSSDIIGRIGGDEFGVVAVGMELNRVESVRETINSLNVKMSKKNKLPFDLSISVGAVNLEVSSSLKNLLHAADQELYEEKKLKHSQKIY